MGVGLYTYVRIKMCLYPYAHIHVSVCSLVCVSLLIVFLLLANYCSKEKLDSTKKLNYDYDYELQEDVFRYAVASVYELDRKYVLIDINGL